MASLSAEKLKEMEAEMNRFEQEIALPVMGGHMLIPEHLPSRPVIGANTYSRIAEQLKQQQHHHHHPFAMPPMPGMFAEMPPVMAGPPPNAGPAMQFIPPQVQQAPHPSSQQQQQQPPPPIINMPPMPTQQMPPQQQAAAASMMAMGEPMSSSPSSGPNPPAMGSNNYLQGPGPGFGPPPPSPSMGAAASSSAVISVAPAVYSAPPVKVKKIEQPPMIIHRRPSISEVTEIARSLMPPIEKPISMPMPPIRKIGPPVMVTVAQPPLIDDVMSSKKKERDRKRKVIRTAGGQTWEDVSLHEWDPDDFRIFCGDLGNDVTDEVLTRAFSKYPSFMKAKVIRDKRNNKTKGFGFVSFKDPQDFIKAMKEMNGKYVGGRPIKLRKSTWRDRNLDIVRKKTKEKQRLGLR